MSSNRALEHTAKKHLMESLGQRDSCGWVCCYCGCTLRLYGEHDQPDSATIDHRTPPGRGGDNSIDNLALCCLRCNGWKGQLTAWEFKAALAATEPESAG